ncbi:retrovirus-related pol polyprotein from transposon TNT 1-94 [Tanacetum coccineum]
MDTLSKVSEYLNNLEAYLDDGNSLEAKKGKVEKSEKELEMFEALEHKSVMVESEKHRVVVFTKAPLRAYSKPFMRFSRPCSVDGQGAWDTKLDMADSYNYMTKEMLDKLGFVRIDNEDYERKMVKEVRVEIHGFIFLVDFVVIGYANEGEPLVIFGRDFLVTTKSKVDFGMGEMRIYLSMLEEERDIDALLVELVETMDEVGSSN